MAEINMSMSKYCSREDGRPMIELGLFLISRDVIQSYRLNNDCGKT